MPRLHGYTRPIFLSGFYKAALRTMLGMFGGYFCTGCYCDIFQY
jgi:hypothetical protein